MMKRTVAVEDFADDEDSEVEIEVEEPKEVTLSPIQYSLKKLTKQVTKYKRQMMKATSEEEQNNIQKSIDYINTLRFILKMSIPNRCIINKVLTYIESPLNYNAIVEDVITKIKNDEI